MRPLAHLVASATLLAASPTWALAADEPAPAPPATSEPAFAGGAPLGLQLALGAQLGGGTGVLAKLGVRAGRFVLAWIYWEHREADGDEQWLRYDGVQLAWFAAPRWWGGPHVGAGLGSLRYEVRGIAYGQPGAPDLSRAATTLELEAGVTLLVRRGWTNALALAAVVIVPLERPGLPAGVDLAAPALVLRLEFNPLLVGGGGW